MQILTFLFLTISWAADDDACPKGFGLIQVQEQAQKQFKELEENVLKEIDDSYYKVQEVDRENGQKVQEWNEKLFQSLDALPYTARDGRKASLDGSDIYDLFLKSNLHPSASIYRVKDYDPKGNIGFCFGRAMHIHLEALKKGLSKDSIRKVWAVGTMQTNTIQWKYHVATMVRGSDNQWWVIDPEYMKPLSLKDWADDTKSLSIDGKLQFFSSHPGRWGPSSGSFYKKSVMEDPSNNGFFTEMLELSRKESAEVAKQRRSKKLPSELEEAVSKLKR